MKPIELRGHDRQITVCRFNFDGDLLFTGGADKKVCVYDGFTAEKIGTYHTSASVKSIDVDVNSQNLFVGNFNGHLEVYEVKTGKRYGLLERQWKIKYLEVVIGDKNLLVVYEKMGQEKLCEIVLLDIESLIKSLSETKSDEKLQYDTIKTVKTYPFPYHITKASFGYLKKYLFFSTGCGSLVKFNDEGKEIARVKSNDGETKGYTISKDHSFIATCGQDGVKFFDPETLKLIRIFKTEVPMNTVAISPLLCHDNPSQRKYHFLMAGGIPAREAAMSKRGGFEIHLANIMYENEIGTIAGSFSPINSIEFSPDGKGFVCGSEEGVSKLIIFDAKYYEL